jgi:hypothetical protein
MPEIGLQRLDLGRDRALRDVERARGCRQRAFARGGAEQAQVVEDGELGGRGRGQEEKEVSS